MIINCCWYTTWLNYFEQNVRNTELDWALTIPNTFLELYGSGGARTHGHGLKRPALYRLSYRSKKNIFFLDKLKRLFIISPQSLSVYSFFNKRWIFEFAGCTQLWGLHFLLCSSSLLYKTLSLNQFYFSNSICSKNV